ncbi:hypothetical protein LCGC14_2835570 [marine sediment metagenome]|uniref:Uncharacterized protein n=1 Tax=marine sediment metagenome TaxID=412755 RepID=A0A0F8YCX1_9ZZZZ
MIVFNSRIRGVDVKKDKDFVTVTDEWCGNHRKVSVGGKVVREERYPIAPFVLLNGSTDYGPPKNASVRTM